MVNVRTLIVLGIIVFGAVVIGLARQGGMPSLGATVAKGDVTVTLSEKGFEPEKLTVAKGTTVTFATTRGEPFWPASDLHPTHDIYPEFDPREPVDASKTWSFRFDRQGTWNYHDHLFPYYRGTITVTNSGQ